MIMCSVWVSSNIGGTGIASPCPHTHKFKVLLTACQTIYALLFHSSIPSTNACFFASSWSIEVLNLYSPH